MAHQEEGWPLGLQLLNVRVARDYFGSISFSTALTTSSSNSSMDSSSDLDTESTGSFFHDRNITLGSLMRTSSIMDLSRRSMRVTRRRSVEPLKPKNKSRAWFFSLCSKDSTNVMNPENTTSLRDFLALHRRRSSTITTASAANLYGRTQNFDAYDEISLAEHLNSVSSSSSLFLNGQIAPPRPPLGSRSAEQAESSCTQ